MQIKSCCKRKTPEKESTYSEWCSCCSAELKGEVRKAAKRGADGHWYCGSCWSKWWYIDTKHSADLPPVHQVFPKFCEKSKEAFELSFPRKSTLTDMCPPLTAGDHPLGAFIANNNAIDDAVRIFFEHGFVILRGVLQPDVVEDVRAACRRLHTTARMQDPEGLGNRGRGRSSFHHVANPGQCFHLQPWSRHLVDNGQVLDVLDAIYSETGRRRDRSKAQKEGKAEESNQDQTATADATNAQKSTSSSSGRKYRIAGAGGDFCEGYVYEFQPMHSDYGRARPLRGPPWWSKDDFPVHEKDMPAMMSVNYIVQPLTRWNGAMRIVPWSEMEKYVDEFSSPSDVKRDIDQDLPPHLVKDSLTFTSGQKDIEVAPLQCQEFKRRPQWLGSKIFPLDAGDVLIRDVRVWHGGCPNLSREPRYLPGFEVSSTELIDHCAWRGWKKAWPSRLLPSPFAKDLSPRAQEVCAAVTLSKEHDYFSEKDLNDYNWVKPEIGFPARRNHFTRGLQLSAEETNAISFRACLEQIMHHSAPHGQQEKPAPLLSQEQAQFLSKNLRELAAAGGISLKCKRRGGPTFGAENASSLLEALRLGPLSSIFMDSEDNVPESNASSDDVLRPVYRDVPSLAKHLLFWLEEAYPNDDDSSSATRRVRPRTSM